MSNRVSRGFDSPVDIKPILTPMKTIKMIALDPTTSLFIYEIDQDGDLVFRSSQNPQNLRKESFVIEKGLCYVGTSYFPAEFLRGVPDNSGE